MRQVQTKTTRHLDSIHNDIISVKCRREEFLDSLSPRLSACATTSKTMGEGGGLILFAGSLGRTAHGDPSVESLGDPMVSIEFCVIIRLKRR